MSIKSVKVHRAALWILGEYTNGDDINAVLKQIRITLGEVSFEIFFMIATLKPQTD